MNALYLSMIYQLAGPTGGVEESPVGSIHSHAVNQLASSPRPPTGGCRL